MIPATLSWLILILPIILSFYIPKYVSFFMAIFVFLWFFRTVEYIFFLLYSYFKFKRMYNNDIKSKMYNWNNNYEKLSKKYKKKYDYLKKNNDYIKTDEVYHVFIVATCGEPYEVLYDTFVSIQNSDFDLKKIIVVLAREERMKDQVEPILHKLELDFKNVFKGFYSFSHPADIKGEVVGKGGNITYSGKKIYDILKKDKFNIKNCLVTTLDSDNRVDEKYLNSLTLSFVSTIDRQKSSYQPLPLFYNNIWEVPLVNRLIAISGGFWHMVESARPHRLHNFSAHAQPLWALKEMNFWAVNTIVEDGHQYWRSYFHFNGDYFVEPLLVPIYQDAVLHTDWKKTAIAQYKQIRRWAWGASDIPFVLIEWKNKFRNLPFIDTLLHFLRLVESHIFWATGAIMVTMSTPIPGLLNPEFRYSGYDDGLAELLSFFFSITFYGIFISLLLSFITLPKPTKPIIFKGIVLHPYFRYINLVIQWFFIPVMTILFGAIPALESQTRLFLGKYLGFNVTEKIRKK